MHLDPPLLVFLTTILNDEPSLQKQPSSGIHHLSLGPPWDQSPWHPMAPSSSPGTSPGGRRRPAEVRRRHARAPQGGHPDLAVAGRHGTSADHRRVTRGHRWVMSEGEDNEVDQGCNDRFFGRCSEIKTNHCGVWDFVFHGSFEPWWQLTTIMRRNSY